MAARGADFGPVQQIALADDTNKAAARVDHRGAADAAFRKQRCQGPDRRVRIDRDHISRHHVYRAHYAPPSVQRLTAAPRFVRGCGASLATFQPAWQEGSSGARLGHSRSWRDSERMAAFTPERLLVFARANCSNR